MWNEASASLPSRPDFDLLLHFLDALFHELKIFVYGPGGGHGCGVALQSPADFQQVGNARILAFHHCGQDAFFPGFRRSDKGALTLPLLQKPHDHQLVDRISHRGAADTKGFGKFPLGEYFLTGLEFTAENQFP